jgi:NAD(P)-dependent dehydrogenase (short-subunit alcohol dehydrogenase family)
VADPASYPVGTRGILNLTLNGNYNEIWQKFLIQIVYFNLLIVSNFAVVWLMLLRFILLIHLSPPRFSNLSSTTLSQTALSPTSARHFWSMMAYNNSKLCNILFGLELARMWEEKGIIVNTLHPGNMVSSSLSRNWWFYRLLFAVVRPFTKSLVSTYIKIVTFDFVMQRSEIELSLGKLIVA